MRFSGASGIRRVAAGRGGRSRACRPARAGCATPPAAPPAREAATGASPGSGASHGTGRAASGSRPPPRPPSPGVSRRPSGARAPVSAPVSAPASAARCSRRTGVSPRRFGQVRHHERHDACAQGLFHGPQDVLGARGVDEDQAAGVDLLAHPAHVQPVGMPAGPDPQDRAFRAPRQPQRQPPPRRAADLMRAPPRQPEPAQKRHGRPVMAIRRPGESGQVHGARLICSLFVLKTAH